MDELVIESERVVTPSGVGPAAVHVSGGRIVAVTARGEGARTGARRVDAGDSVVMPGVVDTHVHLNEPGRTEWEGFRTATRAAAAGGVTTLVDMPLNSIPPTTTVEALERKRAAAAGQCAVDVGFWGGVVPGNVGALAPLVAAGVRGFKCFLVESGVGEFPCVDEASLRTAMVELARLGVPLLVHAELGGPIDEATRALAASGAEPRAYATYLASRPETAESTAIEFLARLCAETRARVHVVHHSAASAVPLLRQAQGAGLPLSAETCPHYLSLAAEEVPDGATAFKCAPPIRGAANREALWAALADGTIDLVASDHSPCSPALKKPEVGHFLDAWGGVSGLQLALAVTWTEARNRGHGPDALARWMCQGPARLAGLAGRKGVIAPGADADLVIWNPEERLVVQPARLEHRHKVTPYAGRELVGVVQRTYVRGRTAFDRTNGFAPSPEGQLL